MQRVDGANMPWLTLGNGTADTAEGMMYLCVMYLTYVWTTPLLLDGHSEERPISAQPHLGGCYRSGSFTISVHLVAIFVPLLSTPEAVFL